MHVSIRRAALKNEEYALFLVEKQQFLQKVHQLPEKALKKDG